jgi:hypothetical protein
MTKNRLSDHLAGLLRSDRAHLTFDAAVDGFPIPHRGLRPPGHPHSPWQLLEHLRLAQWDILEYCRDPDHLSPPFPDGYWPADPEPPSATAWDDSVRRFRADLDDLCRWVADPATDLFAPVPDEAGPTLLHQALMVADHNAYHVGQLVQLRRVLSLTPLSPDR